MQHHPMDVGGAHVAPLTGSVDRNQKTITLVNSFQGSLPSRGAWIEIYGRLPPLIGCAVAPLTGSVDRNNRQYMTGNRGYSRSPHGERG